MSSQNYENAVLILASCIVVGLMYNKSNLILSIPFIMYVLLDNSYVSLFSVILLVNQNIVHSIVILFFHYISTQYHESSFSYIIVMYYLTNAQYSKPVKSRDIIKNKTSYILIFWVLIVLFLEQYNMNLNRPGPYKTESLYASDVSITLNKWYPENNTVLYKDVAQEMVKEVQKPFTIDPQCPICNFKPINKTASTDRDLIIIQAGGYKKKGIMSIRTLRTTGCKARIFLCVNQGEKIDEPIQRAFNLCGVKVFYIGGRNSMYTMRFFINEEFAYEGYKYVDRMLYYDTKDTAFQADPFNEITLPNSLYVSPEFHLTAINYVMHAWYRGLPNFDYNYFRDFEVICNGVFAADPLTMIKLGQLIKSLHLGYNYIAIDQAQYDYLIYTGTMAKAGINVVRHPKFASIALEDVRRSLEPAPLGEFKLSNSSDSYPYAIHQYTRWKELAYFFQSSCNNTNL